MGTFCLSSFKQIITYHQTNGSNNISQEYATFVCNKNCTGHFLLNKDRADLFAIHQVLYRVSIKSGHIG